jgi:NADH dehydrogenase FAD-containing subunit
MRQLVVLGGGTAGTMVANKLRRKLDRAGWDITVVDHDDALGVRPRRADHGEGAENIPPMAPSLDPAVATFIISGHPFTLVGPSLTR